MNQIIITGKLQGDPIRLNDEDEPVVRAVFKLVNEEFSASKGRTQKVTINVRAEGITGEYVMNELFDSAEVLVVGKYIERRRYVPVASVYKTDRFVGAMIVSKLDQNDYT